MFANLIRNKLYLSNLKQKFKERLFDPTVKILKISFKLLKNLGFFNILLMSLIIALEFTFSLHIGILLKSLIYGIEYANRAFYIYSITGSILGALVLDSYKVYMFTNLKKMREDVYNKDFKEYFDDPYLIVRYREMYGDQITSKDVKDLIKKRNKATKITFNVSLLILRALFLSGANINFNFKFSFRDIANFQFREFFKKLSGVVLLNVFISAFISALSVSIKYISSKMKEVGEKIKSEYEEINRLELQLANNAKNALKTGSYQIVEEEIKRNKTRTKLKESKYYVRLINICNNLLNKIMFCIYKLKFVFTFLINGGIKTMGLIDLLIFSIIDPIKEILFTDSKVKRISFFEQVRYLKEAEESESKLQTLKNNLENSKKAWNSAKENTIYKDFENKEVKILIEKNARYSLEDKEKNISTNFVFHNDKDIKLKQGKIYALKGESGSGKSRLMEAISQYNETTKGIILNKDLISSDNKDPDFIFWIAQSKIPEINFKDNTVERYLGINENNRQEISELATDLGIESKLNQDINSLSGGEQTRVMFIKALTSKAKIIFVDEGFSSISNQNKDQLLPKIRNYVKDNKHLILYVQHTEGTHFGKFEPSTVSEINQDVNATIAPFIGIKTKDGGYSEERLADYIINLEKVENNSNDLSLKISLECLNGKGNSRS